MDKYEVADLYDRAADLLMMYGRSRETGEDSAGRLCVLGACALAAGSDAKAWHDWAAENRPNLYALARFVADIDELWVAYGDRWQDLARSRAENTPEASVWMFNDSTYDDGLVIDTLRMCAKELRE